MARSRPAHGGPLQALDKYPEKWWRSADSNRGPTDYESADEGVNGVDASGETVIRRRLRRRRVMPFFSKLPPCLIGVETCATSHHWARELQALGHGVRIHAGQLREALERLQTI